MSKNYPTPDSIERCWQKHHEAVAEMEKVVPPPERGAIRELQDRIKYHRDMDQTYIDCVKLDALDALVQENADLRTRIEEAERRERWIPVSERLPKPSETRRYIVSTVGGHRLIAQYVVGAFGDPTWSYAGVKAWRALPKPYTPTKEQDHE